MDTSSWLVVSLHIACSLAPQVGRCLAVGLVPEVISLGLLRCGCCLAGLGVAYGGRPQLLVGGCVVWDCQRIGGPKGQFLSFRRLGGHSTSAIVS